jgi:hypothetical protein
VVYGSSIELRMTIVGYGRPATLWMMTGVVIPKVAACTKNLVIPDPDRVSK